MSNKNNANGNVTDTQGRVWRICAIPDGVTLANGQTKESIQAELQKMKEKQKEAEKKALEKARRRAKVKREKARKEWEERPRKLTGPVSVGWAKSCECFAFSKSFCLAVSTS